MARVSGDGVGTYRALAWYHPSPFHVDCCVEVAALLTGVLPVGVLYYTVPSLHLVLASSASTPSETALCVSLAIKEHSVPSGMSPDTPRLSRPLAISLTHLSLLQLL